MEPMFWIVLLIVLGTILFFAELVLLPGITVAAVGAFCALVSAASWAFIEYGFLTGFIVLGIILAIVTVMMIFFLRPKTWKKVTLHTEIRETIDRPINELCKVGDHASVLTRLAPMGKVIIEGRVYEAKTMGEYVDEGGEATVIGFDNQNVIVKSK